LLRSIDHLDAEERIQVLNERFGEFDAPVVAAALQRRTAELLRTFARNAIDTTGESSVAVAGGVFANVKANQRIYEDSRTEELYVHPDMRDSGLGLGAALTLYADEYGYDPTFLADVYRGPAYSDEDIERVLQRESLPENYESTRYSDQSRLASAVAELLASGKVVNLYVGRLEYGPRALGNRSTLYQPTDPSAIEWLNEYLERTEFMPFAPVTLKEHAEECYVGYDAETCPAAEFMTVSLDCTDKMKEGSPGVVHVDGTARPQVLERETNELYYEVLKQYYRRTGIPTLINTSFNMHGEPIVCTPSQALESFGESSTHALVLGDTLIQNR
jgi:carbamoyltransferase